MEQSTTKVFMVAVGLFIIIAIISALLVVISNVQKLYSTVDDMNISISELYKSIRAQYDGAEMNIVDLLNTLRKYEFNDNVTIQLVTQNEYNFNTSTKKRVAITDIENSIENNKTNNTVYNTTFSYEQICNVTVRDETSQITIIFEKQK